MDFGLTGKVVVLSGGSMGIGYACARAFACQGARVALAARNRERLESAAERIRQTAPDADLLPVSADMTSWGDVQRFVGAALDRWGALTCSPTSPVPRRAGCSRT